MLYFHEVHFWVQVSMLILFLGSGRPRLIYSAILYLLLNDYFSFLLTALLRAKISIKWSHFFGGMITTKLCEHTFESLLVYFMHR